MKLDYIYHSGFAIEADGVTVIIDYYKDSSEEVFNKGIVHDNLLEKPGVLYVLCSHFHPDHFNREVLSWKKQRPDIRYIFSKDILKHRRASAEDATYINKGDTYEDEHIRIQAFGSTDVGISFLIDLQDRRLFHAGDLNNWHWSEESTPQEIRTGAAGAFLTLEFARRAGNFVALLRLVRTLTLVSEILLHVEVNSVVISLHAEDGVRKDYLTTRLFSLCV